MYVNGKYAVGSIKDLTTQYTKLSRKIKKDLVPGSEKYNREMRKLGALKGKIDAHRRQLRGVESRWSKLKGIAKTYGPVALAAFAGRAIMNGLRQSIGLFRQQEKAVAKVEQALRSTGNAAGRTLQQLKDQASALQNETLFGDEDILNNATAQLLTFTNIAGEQFDRTQAVALDLATVLDGDLKSSSIQLGKALNDPVANLSALSRSGIQFSEDQKAVIKELATTNRLAEAQTVILDELERQYGGQAQAAARVDGGIEQLSNRMGDLLEKIGGLILKGIKPFIGLANDLLDVIDPLFNSVDFGSEALSEQRIEMNALIGVYNTSTTTLEQQKTIRSELNTIIGPYTDKLITEKTTKEDLRDIQNEVNAAMLKEIEIKAKAELIQEAYNRQVEAQKRILESQLELQKLQQGGDADASTILTSVFRFSQGRLSGSPLAVVTDKIEEAKADLQQANDEVLRLQENFGDLGSILAQAQGGGTTSTTVNPNPNPTTEDPKVAATRTQMEQIKALTAQLGSELNAIEQDIADRGLEIRKDALWDWEQLQAQSANADEQRALQKLQNAQMVASGVVNSLGTIAGAAGASAQHQQELAGFMNTINSGLALGQAVASVKASDPFSYLAVLASIVSVITSITSQAESISSSASLPGTPAFATGTDRAPGGISLVGEQGPELVDLPEGSRVIPSGPSRNLLFGRNAQPDFANVPDLSGASGGSSMQMAKEIRELRREIAHWPTKLKVQNVQTDYDEFNERLQANKRRVRNVKV